MMVKSYKISNKIEMFLVYFLADLHIGSPDCNMNKVHKIIDEIAGNERAGVILGGDLMDNALVNSKSDVYTATMKPGKQIQTVASIIRPLVENNQVLGAIDGNHEARTARNAGISPTAVLCDMLGISNLYSPSTLLVNMQFGKSTYKIYACHGSGGGSTVGAKANALDRRGKIIDADIYMQGHTHVPLVFKQGAIRINPETGEEYVADKLYINCGSCLDYRGSYGDVAGFVPTSYGYPAVCLYSDAREPRVIL